MRKSKTKGLLITFVGPSGSGKDTLLKFLQDRYEEDENIFFVKRVITRSSGVETEDFISVSDEDFDHWKSAGKFCLNWQAHGLSYGVPSMLCDYLAEGHIAFLNGARRALPDITRLFPENCIIHVTAKENVLAERLRKRGRETGTDIKNRLADTRLKVDPIFQPIVLDNSENLQKSFATMSKITDDIIRKYKQGKALS